ncbi:MAG TPA: glycosyltransferase family 87 protein, partial [Candidatus Binataceae bacterium]
TLACRPAARAHRRMKQFDAERARKLAWLALAIYLAGLGIAATLRIQGDFSIYYRTGHRVLTGAAIYPADESDRFLYAPVFALFFAPLAMLPRRLAQLAFFIVNAGALVAFIIGSGVMLFGRGFRLTAALIALPVIFTVIFIGNNFEHGQVNLPVLAMCVWAIVYARESRRAVAGAMLAAAVLIKPFALFVALYLLLRGKFAVLGWAIVAGVILIAAPIFVFGPHGAIAETQAYLRAVASMTGRYRVMLTNQSAVAWLARLWGRFGGDAAAESAAPLWTGMTFEAVLAAIEAYWITTAVRAGDDEINLDRMAIAGMFCLMPGFAPISWKSYYAALLVPYMALVAILWEQRRAKAEPSMAESKPPMMTIALFVVSVLINLAPGRYLNRLALFYSASFLSSLAAFMAIATGSRWLSWQATTPSYVGNIVGQPLQSETRSR